MKRKVTVFAAAAVAGLSMSHAFVSNAQAQNAAPVVPELEWNTTLEKFQFDNDKFIGQRFSGNCPARTIRDEDEPIYGTDVYPANNPICVAAVHAGRITAEEGGAVTVQLNPGEEAYTGSSRNGIDSKSLGGSKLSMVFIDPANAAAADEVRKPYIPRLDWDTKFTSTGFGYKQMVGQQFVFDCPAMPANVKPRRIVGTDSYAFNSVVCVAAVHAGKITTDGGTVAVQMDPGIAKLTGSIRNGIESNDGSGGRNTLSFVDAPSAPL